MIIECISCKKKFNVNSELIPSKGRSIQCGSCNHVWFFKPNYESQNNLNKVKSENKQVTSAQKIFKNKQSNFRKKTKENFKTGSEIVKYEKKSNFTFSNFLSYLIVLIISFVALIIILDTFKGPLYRFFPDLELVLFSLFETLKDIKLFIKDLTKL
tara:strand:+ start:84 stop:551 length:468 start_codon:yes stop_codon:yes gene_type:complete